MSNYTIYHLHSDQSNPSSGTGADSVTKFHQYLDRAEEEGMKNFAFSEHGTISNWIKKKEETEKRGMKYIHANEVYLTEHKDKERGLVRDNYHYMMIAKNFDGVQELNALTSESWRRDNGGFYYNPRISFDELKNTSDNIIMTSACLASPLWRMYKREKNEQLKDMLDFMHDNKHRMFFEIQYHNHPDQIEFNKYLYDLSRDMDIPLIAGTDTHALNQEHAETRNMFMKAKNISYGDEDTFDLTFKNYDQLVEMFRKQNALPKDVYMEAIENTNVMADMVEEFKVDDDLKYPKLYDDSVNVFKKKISEGAEKRKIDLKEDRKRYYNRIEEEFKTYEKMGAVDYMLLQKNIIDWGKRNGIHHGYGRGSVSGSLIAYLLGITEVDSVKYNLNFTRFLNPARVTAADIDVDYAPSERQDVIDYVASLDGVYFSEIITYNTLALKGSIREIGRAMKIPLNEVDEIAKNIEDQESKYRKEYPELFKHVDVIHGVIKSVGSHPSGFLVSPIPLNTNIGTMYTNDSKYPVSLVNMKELEGKNYIKLDILGLDAVETVNKACEYAGIERLTPDNIDFEDYDVWKSMTESTLGVFQWESNTAQSYVKKLFSDRTIENIEKEKGKVDFLDLLSAGNGAIRPAGASYRDELADGQFHDNGHEALNNFLHETNGFLIYQEQINKFLVEFCMFSESEADLVRRGLSKKIGTEQFLPKIRSGFIKTMKEKYKVDEERSEEIIEYFLGVIEDAAGYGFSINHSLPYSSIGYINAYLRYHYPLAFFTAMLNVKGSKKSASIEEVGDITRYAQHKGIEIKHIEYGKSLGDYTINKEDNAIYKGVGSIKGLNSDVAQELYKISKLNPKTFVDLLIEISKHSKINKTQLNTLIKLDFFKQFGDKFKLLDIAYEVFGGKFKYDKKHKDATKEKRYPELIRIQQEIMDSDDKRGDISEQIMFEIETLGYGQTTFPNVHKDYFMLIESNLKYTPKLKVYQMKTGKELSFKIGKKLFFKDGDPKLEPGDIFKVINAELRPKKKMIFEKDEFGEEKKKFIDTDEDEIHVIGWEVSKKA